MIRRVQALSGFIGRKGLRRWFSKSFLKDPGLTRVLEQILLDFEEVRGQRNLWWSSEMR